jgi:hypothetical protein
LSFLDGEGCRQIFLVIKGYSSQKEWVGAEGESNNNLLSKKGPDVQQNKCNCQIVSFLLKYDAEFQTGNRSSKNTDIIIFRNG